MTFYFLPILNVEEDGHILQLNGTWRSKAVCADSISATTSHDEGKHTTEYAILRQSGGTSAFLSTLNKATLEPNREKNILMS